MGKVVDFSRPSQPPRKINVTIADCGNDWVSFRINSHDFGSEKAAEKVLLFACRTYVGYFDRQEAQDWYTWDDKRRAALPWWRRIFS